MILNASRFIAPTINVKSLPQPSAIEELDVETILAERMAEFQRRANQAGFPYDVGALETDPIKIDQEAHAYRELLMRARINSAIRAVLPAFAQGSDLDAIAARANVQRLVISPASDGKPPVYESDTSLLVRYLTAFAAPSAGSYDAYVYHAITTEPRLRDVSAVGPDVHGVPGMVKVYLLWNDGQTTPVDVVNSVRTVLSSDRVKPLTDYLTVSAANIIPYTIDLKIHLPFGPAPADVVSEVRKSIRIAVDARYAIGADVWLNYIEGAAYVANVKKVTLLSPLASIEPGYDSAAYCTSINVSYEVEG